MGEDRLQAELDGPSLWYRLERLSKVDSTNDEALRRIDAGDGPGLVVVADHQTAGRGRRGRGWEDRPGGSIAITLVLPAVEHHPTLVPVAVGVATADALRRHGARAELKWPNDVLLDGRKCAGILVEQHHRGAAPVVLAGIGINLDWRGVGPEDRAPDWGSVAEAIGADVDRWALLADLLRAMAAWIADLGTDPHQLLATYRARCSTIGQRVTVETPDDAVTGRARDVDDDGALLVETDDGRLARITAGDVVHLRPTG